MSAIGAFLLTRRYHSINRQAVASLEDQALTRFHQSTNSRFDSIYLATKLLPSLLIFSTLNFLLAILVWEICTSGVIVLLWLFVLIFVFLLVIPLLGKLFIIGKEAFKRRLFVRGSSQARREHDDTVRSKMYETILSSICCDIRASHIPHMRIISALQLTRASDLKNQAADEHWIEVSSSLRQEFDRKTHIAHYSSDDIHLLEQVLRSYLVNKPSPIQPAFHSYFHRIPPNNAIPDDAVNAILWTLLGERMKDANLPTYGALVESGRQGRAGERNEANSDQQ